MADDVGDGAAVAWCDRPLEEGMEDSGGSTSTSPNDFLEQNFGCLSIVPAARPLSESHREVLHNVVLQASRHGYIRVLEKIKEVELINAMNDPNLNFCDDKV